MDFFLGLLFLLPLAGSAFTANNGLLVRPVAAESSVEYFPIKPKSTLHTSLHVGVSYGPPMDDPKGTLLLRRHSYHRFDAAPFFDVDPAFSSALSIGYDAKEEQERRKVKRSVAASTAVVCFAYMTQKLATSGAIPYLLSLLPHFYQAYPLQASIATCGLNSVFADTVSQIQSWKPKEGLFEFEWKQSMSSITYGSIVLGIGSNLVYTKLLPTVLGGTNGLTTILASALMDNFLFAPLLWLPPAYAIKAWFQGNSITSALKTYVNAVRKEKLMHRYMMFWLPAQCLTFGCVPKHLRVVSTAAFSFVWMMLLNKITSSNEK